MSVAEEIKARLDIVTYIQQYAPLKKAGRYYKAPCPFHTEKTPSFSVNPDTQTWRCFGACAEGGDIFSFAMKQHGWNFSEALQELGRAAGVETRKQTPEQKGQSARQDHLRAALNESADIYHRWLTQNDEGADALRYAREKRGFTDETITRFKVGYAPPGWQTTSEELKKLGFAEADLIDAGLLVKNDAGRVYERFRNRLMIPIRDERGRVIGFGARALDPDDNPKYLNSPQSTVFDKSRTLFGLDTAKTAIRDSGIAVIVEGYMDAVQAQQAGFHNVVAQMGTALTESQLKLLAPRYANKIILALDSDAAGQNATMRSLEVARHTLEADYAGRLSVDMRILHIPDAKDPDDLIRETPERWLQLVETATPVADYVIEVEIGALGRDATLQEREAVARRVLPMLVASENDLYRADNLQKLALKLRIPERELLAWAQEQKAQLKAQAARQKAQPPRQQSAVDEHGDGGGGGGGETAPYMPPTNYDNLDALEIPLEDDYGYDGLPNVDGGAVPATVAVAVAAAVGRPIMPKPRPQPQSEVESYCLRALLRDPNLLFTINRKFRELAGENNALSVGPLSDFSADDFQHGDHRALMQMFRLAVKQDERDPLTYLRENLDPSLLRALEGLQINEADVIRDRMKRRFDGDAAEVWKQHEKRVVGYVDASHELLDKALRLRAQRLQRDSQEMQFLQMDAHAEGDDAGQMQYGQYMIVALQAKRLIEAALKQQSAHFV